MSDGLQSACKKCMNVSWKRSRQKKLAHYKQVQKQRQSNKRKEFNEWKSAHICELCGEQDSCCLDLHHLDPKEKDIEVSLIIHSWSWKRIQQEVQKCIIICANCHRKVHAGKISLVDNRR